MGRTGPGTIGQHDAGEMTGGSYTLVGGFWAVAKCPTPELLTVCKDDVPAKAKKDVYVWPVDPAFAAGGLTSVSIELNMNIVPVAVCVKNTGPNGPTTASLVAEGPVGCYSVVFNAPVELQEWTTVQMVVQPDPNPSNCTEWLCFHVGWLPSDTNSDGGVTLTDANTFGQNFPGGSTCHADINNDGGVTLSDGNSFGQLFNSGWLGASLPPLPDCGEKPCP